MHSPDHKSHIVKKTTNLNNKKKDLPEHLFRGSVISSTPKSASGGSRLMTSNSDIRSANRFEEHSQSFSKFSTHLDLQIKHQSKTDSFSSSSRSIAGELASPRSSGNPILQSGDEKTHQWKPLAKRHGNSYKTSIFSEEPQEKPRGMAKGVFSDEARKGFDEVPEKKTGIRTIPQKDTIHLDQSPKRQLKVVHSSPEKSRPCPITQGEEPNPVKPRITEQQVSDWTKKSNAKGAWLPSDRNEDSPRRVRLEKPSEVKSLFESSSTPKGTSSNTMMYSEQLKAKKVGNVGSLFDHGHYNDSKLQVTGKCGEVNYSTIKSNLNVEKTYSRVKVDIHI